MGRLRPLSRKGGSGVPPRRKFLNFISKMVHFRAFGGKLSNAIELVDTAVYIFEKDIAAKAFKHSYHLSVLLVLETLK